MRAFYPLLAFGLLLACPAFGQTNTTICVKGSVGNCIPVGSGAPFPVTDPAVLAAIIAGYLTPPIQIMPSQRTLVTLDIKTVTTGGTAVTAIATGHRTAGGFLTNPIGATISLCINEIGTAVGTTSSGDTTCIQPGQSYSVAPAAGAVSVISSDSSHPFSGYGMQ